MEANTAIDILKKSYPKTCKMVAGRYKGGFDDLESDLGKAITTAICALEKQIERVPNNIKDIKFTGSIREQFKNGTCPCCNQSVDTDDDLKYCSECGQKLQWTIKL